MSLDSDCCQEDQLIVKLKCVIRQAVRVLAILMTLVIIWSVIDVAQILFVRVAQPPVFLLSTSDILKTFGDFLAVFDRDSRSLSISRSYLRARRYSCQRSS